MKNKIKLYSKDAKGKIIEWSIWSEGNILFMEFGVLNGATQIDHEPISSGLAGRTLEQQIDSRIKSRVNKQLDKGYVRSLEVAKKNEKRNALGYKHAAKCTPFNGKDGTFFAEGSTGVQMKLNGHHASVVNDGGKLFMYSNGGKLIETVPEILSEIDIPKGRTIEGELYCHGQMLQTISSWVRRRQPDTLRLEYHVYDIDLNINYIERDFLLKEYLQGEKTKALHTAYLTGEFNLEPLLENALINKYEGLVLRLEGYGHDHGKRGKGLIKVKPRHFENFRVDDEFLVIDIIPSKDGWAILVCETELGKKFKVTVHGTHQYKKYVLEHKEEFIGKHIRAEFESYTKDKKPAQPVALYWREKEEE